jgi:Family of unknown function (DUF6356)
MRAALHRLFLSHPQAVDESYGEHFLFALGFAACLFGAGLAALVHAVVPCLFETTASRLIREMHERIADRRAPVRHASTPPAALTPANRS